MTSENGIHDDGGGDRAAEAVEQAIAAFRAGSPVCLFDSARREQETDLLFPAVSVTPAQIRGLRQCAGGLIFMAVGDEICDMFGLPFLQDVYTAAPVLDSFPAFRSLTSHDIPYDSRSAFSVTLNHRDTFTGITDKDRSLTVRRFAELSRDLLPLWPEAPRVAVPVANGHAGNGHVHDAASASCSNAGCDDGPASAKQSRAAAITGWTDAVTRLGSEFRTPGHVPLCRETRGGVTRRQGHTELSVALARLADICPVVVGAEMMQDDGDHALAVDAARAWSSRRNIPFIEGAQLVHAVSLSRSRS